MDLGKEGKGTYEASIRATENLGFQRKYGCQVLPWRKHNKNIQKGEKEKGVRSKHQNRDNST
jgi:hypothetical protein